MKLTSGLTSLACDNVTVTPVQRRVKRRNNKNCKNRCKVVSFICFKMLSIQPQLKTPKKTTNKIIHTRVREKRKIMIRREKNRRAPPADLLVCFPTRSNLTLMSKPKPKAICGPAKQSSFTNGHGRGRVTRNNSMILSKNKQVHSDVSEPTSPKVTCSGQIKVKPKGGRSCKNWQSVMEEIEKLHNNNKKKNNNNKIKKPIWGETFGFLTCLRTLRFDFRCFGSFPTTVISSSDDEDEDEDEDEDDEKDTDHVQKRHQVDKNNGSSETVFSKWFMVLQEEQNSKERSARSTYSTCVQDDNDVSEVVPPSNALLLMRCGSAPAKSWLEEEDEDDDEEKENKLAEKVIEEEMELNKKKKLEQDETVLMRYETDFYKILSSDIAKETWVIGGNNKDQMPRSRSCKR